MNFALFSSYNDCYERIECDFSALTQMSAGPVILTLLLSDVRWASLLPPPSQSVFTNNILTTTAAPLITSLDDQSWWKAQKMEKVLFLPFACSPVYLMQDLKPVKIFWKSLSVGKSFFFMTILGKIYLSFTMNKWLLILLTYFQNNFRGVHVW